jgi:hypothetical protein
LNLSTDIPQNSFRSIAAALVDGSDHLLDVSAVFQQGGKEFQESDGVFVLSPPVSENVKHFSYVLIVVNRRCKAFVRLAAAKLFV